MEVCPGLLEGDGGREVLWGCDRERCVLCRVARSLGWVRAMGVGMGNGCEGWGHRGGEGGP